MNEMGWDGIRDKTDGREKRREWSGESIEGVSEVR